VYALLSTLAKTKTVFPTVPPVAMLLLSYAVEWYCLLQYRYLGSVLPPIRGDLLNIQPALFSVSTTHVVVDDSKARKSPGEGGLGYQAPLRTMEAMCVEMMAWNALHAGADEGAQRKQGEKGVLQQAEEAVEIGIVDVVGKA